MAWHGPKGNCGCCGTPPPPPPPEPPCFPTTNICLWDGREQFAGVWTEVEVTDTVLYYHSQLLAPYATTFINYIGLSGVNGTYIGAYVGWNEVDQQWATYDPLDPDSPCGGWFFPWVDLSLTNELYVNTAFVRAGPPSMWFSVATGRLYYKDIDNDPRLIPLHYNTIDTPLACASGRRTAYREYFPCVSLPPSSSDGNGICSFPLYDSLSVPPESPNNQWYRIIAPAMPFTGIILGEALGGVTGDIVFFHYSNAVRSAGVRLQEFEYPAYAETTFLNDVSIDGYKATRETFLTI